MFSLFYALVLELVDMELKVVFFVVGLSVIFVIVGEVESRTRNIVNVEQQHITKPELYNDEGIRGGK
jgi:hypothetical protein